MNDLQVQIIKFISHLENRNFSKATIDTRRQALERFSNYGGKQGIVSLKQLNVAFIEKYARYTHRSKNREGKPLSISRKITIFVSVKLFLEWLYKNGSIFLNLSDSLTILKPPFNLPRNIFTVKEIDKMIKAVDLQTNYGMRDRAILETFYSTGIRRLELAELKLADIDYDRQVLYVRKGKGGKQRIVPIGKRAMKWLELYLQDTRARLLKDNDDKGFVFVSNRSSRLCNAYLCMLISGYRKKAGIEKDGSCHSLRHSAATHMLKNGADIRYIQEMLGHERISTTYIYTHVDITDLKRVYQKTHPSATWENV